MELLYLKCQPEHLRYIETQKRDDEKLPLALNPAYANVLTAGLAYSVWAGSRCIGAAGLMKIFDQRALGWALLSPHSGPYMREVTHKFKRALDLQPFNRVEISVDCDFELGHRWAKLLGFTVEAERMHKSGRFGTDETLYARVK